MLELNELMRVPHVVACPLNFNFLCDRRQQREVLKHRKNDHFLVFLALLVLFPKFLGVAYNRTAQGHETPTCSCVSNYFILFGGSGWQRGVFEVI